MREFKVGEEVVLTRDYWPCDKGEVLTVTDNFKGRCYVEVTSKGGLDLIPKAYLKHKCPNPPHKHMKEIIEWAKGADIEAYQTGTKSWSSVTPNWSTHHEFRVKEPTQPKTERELKIEDLEAQMADIAKQIKELK